MIKDILKKSHEVIASSSELDSNSIIHMDKLGISYEPIFLKRHGLNLIDDIRTLISLLNLYRRQKLELILAHGIKLVIWGGISARISKTPFFALITGLGFAFQGTSFKRRLLTKLVSFLYRIALKNSKAVIFQNKDKYKRYRNIQGSCKMQTKKRLATGAPGTGATSFFFALFV